MIAALLLAAALDGLPPVPQAEPAEPRTSANTGRVAYEERCASCHGVDLRGGPDAPPLLGVGAADLDLMLGTGRMPAAIPWIEVDHRGAQMSQATIDAIVAYVVAVAPGGLPIPVVKAGGDALRGFALFRENCMHCHGIDPTGGSIGGVDFAPSLEHATVTQVAEAIRVGPGEMPKFGERQISDRDLDDIATALSDSHASAAAPEVPLPGSGPVPAGLLGWLSAGLMAAVAYAFSAGTGKKDKS